jgi:hypothetical protein
MPVSQLTRQPTSLQWLAITILGMTYTALAVLFLFLCIGIGARATNAERNRLAVFLALAMVATQFALLMGSA